ncbi:alpha/beta fold hydrolase [Demetria terragena]|uniref:alpha/beta fold hydrolase n=1 Tax=Demetria terragena TaxID=63959 RepID=UPI00037E50AF|nr:alpha/beta hydrolase [Demetria terragena]
MSAINYTRTGQGEPVVLIHGLGHHGNAWGKVPAMLSEHCDVVVVDLPGHGGSSAPTAPHTYNLDSIADQLEELFDELEVDRPHVVGNSLGGFLALELARRAAVVSATAISPAGFGTQRELLGIAMPQLLALKLASMAPRRVLSAVSQRPGLRAVAFRALYSDPRRQTPEDAYKDSLNLRQSSGFWPLLIRASKTHVGRDIPTPVTIVWGTDDRLLIPRQADRAARALPSATVERWPGCGHVPMVDDPERVVRLIQRQVERASVAG